MRQLSPEFAFEAAELGRRIELAHDLGAAVLEMPDAFETIESTRHYLNKLYKTQPNLAMDIMKLEGRYYSILIDGCV